MRLAKLSQLEVKWCLYDVGNSAFYTTIVAGFFPVFFKQYWNQGVDPNVSTYYLSLASSIASLVVAFTAPFMGALVDRLGRSQLWLALFTALSVIGCVGLAQLGSDQTQGAMWVFCGISVGAALAVAIYDSMLMKVTEAHRLSKVSLWGYALGYLGGGVLFSINIALTLKPEWFGLRDSVVAVKVSFVTVGLWWLGFSLPLVLSRQIKAGSLDKSVGRIGWFKACLQALGSLYETMRTISSYKSVVWFLVAYWFYIDGVGTVMRMAVDYGMSLGFAPSH